MKPNECFAYFALRAFSETPEEVSAALGLSPSKAWRAGDPHDAHRIPGKKRTASFWRVDSRLARTAGASFEDHVKDVLEQLSPRFELAATLSKKHNGLIELVGYFHEYNPGLHLSASAIQRVAELGAEIDCDFYYLAEEDQRANKAPEPTPGSVTPRASSGESK